MQSYDQASAYIAALTGSDTAIAIVDIRAIHDQRKDLAAHHMRGTLAQLWNAILSYQSMGYGIFANINLLDNIGRHADNVQSIRAHAADLDNINSHMSLQRALQWQPAPSFTVNSSPGKYHVYWIVSPYIGNDYFTHLQRQIRIEFDADKTIIDASRVLRLPGTLHLKEPSAPFLVTCQSAGNLGRPIQVETLAQSLQHVVLSEHIGQRHALGEPSLAAPSLQALSEALQYTDPNQLSRGEWISFTAAVKQAGWTLATPDVLMNMWLVWCMNYTNNDPGENIKQWNSLTDTQNGWQSLLNRNGQLKAKQMFGGGDSSSQVPPTDPSAPQQVDTSSPVLTDGEQRAWFNGVVYVTNIGEMLTPDNRYLNTSQFNSAYGGKRFILDAQGKLTDEAWKAATRGTLWQIPKVDHVRFVPSLPFGENIMDDMGRIGRNVYKPHMIIRKSGDISPFLRHIYALLPEPCDQRILLDYLAHNAKYPGFKIPWAPVIQSAEGAGKNVLKLVMSHVIGRSYVYFPNAQQLGSSGSQFNAWMRNKLFILADEIKVDDRRELIEILKPMISEERIEIQSKGVDQEIEDNFANWLFFTNYKDAIPVSRNGRRYSVMFSPIQSANDLLVRQMHYSYFTALYNWLRADGAAIVADWLMNYPIEHGAIPMRAPETSSMEEAITITRGPIERVILDAIEDGVPGFCGGWIAIAAVMERMKAKHIRSTSDRTVEAILTGMGYVSMGRAPRAYMQQGEDKVSRTMLYHRDGGASVDGFAAMQGWE